MQKAFLLLVHLFILSLIRAGCCCWNFHHRVEGVFFFSFFFYVQYTAAVADGRSHQRDTSHRDWVREGKSKGTWEQSEAAASFPGLQLYGLRGEAKLDHKTDCTAVAAILSSPSPPPYGVACNTSLSQPPHIHNTQSQQQGPPISSPFLL